MSEYNSFDLMLLEVFYFVFEFVSFEFARPAQ